MASRASRRYRRLRRRHGRRMVRDPLYALIFTDLCDGLREEEDRVILWGDGS